MYTHDLKDWISRLASIIFISCVLILFSGDCAERPAHEQWSLEFISTQMCVCLDNIPVITYGVVGSSAVHMLLLLHTLVQCVQSNNESKTISICQFSITDTKVVVACCFLIISFGINLAAVAEFRNDAASTTERDLHYISAVATICFFWAIHVVISMYLQHILHFPDKSYSSIRNIYAILTILFFLLWVIKATQNWLSTIIIEWLILGNAFLMQCYSEHSLQQHTQSVVQHRVQLPFISFKIFLNYIVYIITWCLIAPPWVFVDSEDLQTGPEYWGFVTLFSIVITIQLRLQL